MCIRDSFDPANLIEAFLNVLELVFVRWLLTMGRADLTQAENTTEALFGDPRIQLAHRTASNDSAAALPDKFIAADGIHKIDPAISFREYTDAVRTTRTGQPEVIRMREKIVSLVVAAGFLNGLAGKNHDEIVIFKKRSKARSASEFASVEGVLREDIHGEHSNAMKRVKASSAASRRLSF